MKQPQQQAQHGSSVSDLPLRPSRVLIARFVLSVCVRGQYFNQISCPTTATCFAVGENDVGALIYRSVDGGESWTEVYYEAGLSLMAVTALSTSEIWVGGGVQDGITVGHALHSLDGGQTWDTTLIQDNYISAFSFPDPEHGFAVSLNTMQQSGVLTYSA